MESDNGDHNMGAGSSSGGAPATSSRWNPTKEQINLLEGLYRQGIRTPSAEQIKQITSRLKAFGHIEGKNVFYWFQNHKARQRQKQKQKQENMVYVNRVIYKSTQPIFPALPSHHHPYPNVVCGPCYLPVGSQSDHRHHAGTSTHQQCHPNNNVPPISNSIITLEKLEKISGTISYSVSTGSYEPGDEEGYYRNYDNSNKRMMSNSSCNQETLALFPLSPTGVFEARSVEVENNPSGIYSAYDAENNPSTSNGSSTPSSSSGVVGEGAAHDQPFYDFFSRT